jgi:hypothetical protein
MPPQSLSPKTTPRSLYVDCMTSLKYCRRILQDGDSHTCIRICLDTVTYVVRNAIPNYVKQLVAMGKELYHSDAYASQVPNYALLSNNSPSQDTNIVPEAELCRWLTKHRHVVYLLEERRTGFILGAIGFWPLLQETLHKFMEGELHDGNLKAEHSAPNIVPGANRL